MKKNDYTLVKINKNAEEPEELIFEPLESSHSNHKKHHNSNTSVKKTSNDVFDKAEESGASSKDKAAGKATETTSASPEPSRKPLSRKAAIAARIASVSGSIICGICMIFLMAWVTLNLHPDIYLSSSGNSGLIGNILATITKKTSNMKGDVMNGYLSDADIIKKIYTIPEDATVAPAPNTACYGKISYDEADKVYDIIEQARRYRLLDEDERVVFTTDADLYARGEIEYYLDETILVLCWKERINNRVVNISEIRIADGSQLRRKLTGDTYGSGVQSYCSSLSNQANAVVGFNADFYAFRNLGITCYNRTVYRFGESPYGGRKAYNCVDTLFIDSNGDFHYFERGMEATKEEVQKFVDDNDILFSMAFGPILIKDGEYYNTTSYAYPIGEYYDQYSRAGIGLVSEHHYLYMNVQNNGSHDEIPRATLQDFAEIMYSKNLEQAYNLDGGQTGEVYFNGHVFNYVDWGNERAVSDIFYFATAIPEDERE